MIIDSKFRTIIIADKDLSNPENADWSSVELLSVMLYPEHPEQQKQYCLGIKRSILKELCPTEEKTVILQNDLDFAVECALDEKGEALATFEKTLYSRKSGLTGSFAVRGSIAGRLLCILSKPHVKDLKNAYGIYIDGFDPKHGVATPTEPLLKKIWKEFKYVSHFWAAYTVYREEYNKVLFSKAANWAPGDNSVPERFYTFLRIASFFNDKLIKSSNNHTSFDTEKIWHAATKDKKSIPPLQLLLK